MSSWPRSSRWRERRRRCSKHSSSPPAGSPRGPRVGLLSTWWPGDNGRDYDDDDDVDAYDGVDDGDYDDHVYDEKPHSAPEVWSHKTHEALHTVGPPWADGDDPEYNFGHFSYIFRWQKSLKICCISLQGYFVLQSLRANLGNAKNWLIVPTFLKKCSVGNSCLHEPTSRH